MKKNKCECIENLCSKSLKKVLNYYDDTSFTATSDCRDKLRDLGDLRVSNEITKSYCIIPEEDIPEGSYII